jgi:hypothetical protein
MKVYELLDKLKQMPQLADVNIVFDCGFALRDIQSVYFYYDGEDPVVCLDEGKNTRISE